MQSELEILLAQAAVEPAHRPAFFQCLLDADAWVPGRSTQTAIDKMTSLDLQHWEKADGSSVIPFFTSEQALLSVCDTGQSRVRLPVRGLFELTRGEALFLNPKLETGKEFSAAEIDALLTDKGSALSEQTVVTGGQSLLLSEVSQPPAQLIRSLTTLFASYKVVKRAFLAQVKESREGPANLLIGIEADADIEAVIQAAGTVAIDTLPDDMIIDLCEITEHQPGISHFFTAHITPFYERRWGSFLRDFKGGERIV